MPDAAMSWPRQVLGGEHFRPDGTECSYLAFTACNKCGNAAPPGPGINLSQPGAGDPNEWSGRVHVLHVIQLGEPCSIDGLRPIEAYEIEHLPTLLGCPVECRELYGGRVYADVYLCDVGWQEQDGDLAFSLKYSGTEITEPGTYLVQAWGRKYCSGPDFITEYDGGLAVVEAGDG